MAETEIESFYYLVITVSVMANGLVVAAFLYSRSRMTFKEYFLVSLAACDGIQAVFGYLPEIIGMNQSKTGAGLQLCQGVGFLVTFCALSSIAHLMMLSLERTLTIVYPYKSDRIRSSAHGLKITMAVTWSYGFIWAIMPIIGWSSYEVESNGRLCSVNWADDSAANKSYVMLLFIFCFVVPLGIFLFSFVAVSRELRSMADRAKELMGKEHASAISTLKAKRKHSKTVFIMVIIFLVSWTPYAVVAFLTALNIHVSSTMTLVSAFLGKSSTLYNPFVYAFTYKNFRKAVLRLVGEGGNSVGPSDGSSVNTTATV